MTKGTGGVILGYNGEDVAKYLRYMTTEFGGVILGLTGRMW